MKRRINILLLNFLISLVIFSSIAFSMRPDHQEKHKRIKHIPLRQGYAGPTIKLLLQTDEKQVLAYIPLHEAKLSLTIKILLEDFGEEIPEDALPLQNPALKSLDHVVACLKIIGEENDVALKLDSYIKKQNLNDLRELILTANYLDITRLFEPCYKEWEQLCLSEPGSMILGNKKNWLPADISHACLLHCGYNLKEIENWFSYSKGHPIYFYNKVDETWSYAAQLNVVGFDERRSSITPDGKKRATLDFFDRKTTVFYKFTGRWTKAAELYSNKIFFSLSFSPDGKMLALGSMDSTIELYGEIDEKWTHLIGFELHEGSICSVVFSPDGKILAGGSRQNKAYLFSEAHGKWEHVTTLESRRNHLHSVIFSPDSKTLALAFLHNAVELWNKFDGEWKCTTVLEDPNLNLCFFSPDGNTLALASPFSGRMINLWTKVDGNWNLSVRLENIPHVRDFRFSPDGKTLAMGFISDDLMIFDEVGGAWPRHQRIKKFFKNYITFEQGKLLMAIYQAYCTGLRDLKIEYPEIFNSLPQDFALILESKGLTLNNPLKTSPST